MRPEKKEMEYPESSVFVTGLARPAKEDPVASIYDVFFLSLVVDKDSELILDATCNTAREMTNFFIRSLLVGHNLQQLEPMVQAIQHRFFGMLQKPLVVALKDAHNRYMIAKKTGAFEF